MQLNMKNLSFLAFFSMRNMIEATSINRINQAIDSIEIAIQEQANSNYLPSGEEILHRVSREAGESDLGSIGGPMGPMGRKLPQVKGMVSSITDMTIKEVSDIVKNYGCYCFVGGTRLPGHKIGHHAEPVDELDRACRKLARAEKCLAIDSNDGLYGDDDSCHNDQGYNWYYSDDGEIICGHENEKKRERKNEDGGPYLNCKIDLCNLEKEFSLIVRGLLDEGYETNDMYHKMSEQEYHDTCVSPHAGRNVNGGTTDNTNNNSPGNVAHPVLSCCGSNLERNSYNSLTSECCEDGKIRPFGMC